MVASSPSGEETVEDMTTFSNLSLDLINRNLCARYKSDLIYTLSGPGILISINPYKPLPSLYSPTSILHHPPPAHIYSIASQAYANATRLHSRSQSLVISGESGAGKTESTKFVLQYFCSTNRADNGWMESQILEANVVLEAFGNSKTVRNDNSSRFGKFLQVWFRGETISGCVVQDYLLEKSRIVRQGVGERNYHVFYQLVGAGMECGTLGERYLLKHGFRYLQAGCASSREGEVKETATQEGDPAKFKETSQEGDTAKFKETSQEGDTAKFKETSQEGDPAKFQQLLLAMNILQISEPFIDGLFRALSAILWLGEIEFTQSCDGEPVSLNQNVVGILEQLLGIKLENLLLQREIQVRGSVTIIPFSRLEEASENRHSMAKALYARVFTWLIEHINGCTRPEVVREEERFIGLLDIFGFENFAVNSFEQLCINYANEKLQRFFNFYVLGREQEIYSAEGLEISTINYTDNSGCLELIEKPPRCLLRLLSEQCHLPKGSDTGYLLNLCNEFGTNPAFSRPADPRLHSSQFSVLHYAGQVTYTVQSFVDKNRDVGQEPFFASLSSSPVPFIRALSTTTTTQQQQTDNAANIGTTKRATVCEAFRSQLHNLVTLLEKTGVWYIRCIKPNTAKAPSCYDESLVMDQLRYLGMVEIIRIRREGFPVHYCYTDFARRFGGSVDSILEKYSATRFQLGHSKVFLKLDLNMELERERAARLNAMATVIQSRWRRFIRYGAYRRKRVAASRIQAWFRSRRARLSYLQMRKAAVTIQAALRGLYGREAAGALRAMRLEQIQVVEESVAVFDEMDLVNTDVEESIEPCCTTDLEEEAGTDLESNEPCTDLESSNEPDMVEESRSPSPLPEPPLDCKLPEPCEPPPPVPTTIQPAKAAQLQQKEEPIYSELSPTPQTYLNTFASQYFKLKPKEKLDQLTSYTKSTSIHSPHIHLYDPENNQLSKLIWKDLHRVMRQYEARAVQTIIGHGIERVELRDEIYVQTMRLLIANPCERHEENLWSMLMLVISSFTPSKPLLRCLHGYLEAAGAKWCLVNLSYTLPRELPPSTVEVQAARKRSPLSIRVYFLDSRSITIEVHAKETAGGVVRRLAGKLGIAPLSAGGWWLFSVAVERGEIVREEHVAMHGFLFDVVAGWEMDQQSAAANRLLFKRRIFKPLSEEETLLQGPELRLVYCQLLYEVVRKHSLPLPLPNLIKLAGIQARVLHHDNLNYTNIEAFLPSTYLSNNTEELIRQVHASHRKCSVAGDGARVLYLQELGPYYGVTFFPAICKPYSTENLTHFGVGPVMIYRGSTTSINYTAIKSLNLHSTTELTLSMYSSEILTIESGLVKEICSLIGSYCDRLALKRMEFVKEGLRLSNRERDGLQNQILRIRGELVEREVVTIREDGLFSTLKKMRRRDARFWSWSKAAGGGGPVTRGVDGEEAREVGGLVAGWGAAVVGDPTPTPSAKPSSINTIQHLLHKTYPHPQLYDELYLQLIKQTTSHPSPNSSSNVRNWSLLALLCSLRLPTNQTIRKYLLAHLRLAGYDHVTANGNGGRWAEKCLQETIISGDRSQFPSQLEIHSTLSMRPIPLRVYLLDGKFQTLQIRPGECVGNLLLSILERVGLTKEAKGYALYEFSLGCERSLNPEERPAELLSKWETGKINYKFCLKKHLFIDGWIDLKHPIEKELIYLQLLHATRGDRFPLSETEAAILVALQAQIELGDYPTSTFVAGEFPDYCHVSAHCLPTRVAAVVSHEAVARHHQSLAGSGGGLMRQAVLNLLMSWGWWKATVFEVTQSFTSCWPRNLWLAVDQMGVHLAQRQRGSAPLASFEYETIHSFTPSPTYFLLIAATAAAGSGGGGRSSVEAKPSKIVLNTACGYQIGQLIRDYITNVFSQPEIVVQ